MYQYKINLNYKIENCTHCPFRQEHITYESIDSSNKMSGVTSITRRVSMCNIRNKVIDQVESVNAYNSNCPLKNNCVEIKEE